MYSKKDLMDLLKQQLATEYNCSKKDFEGSANIITRTTKNESQRNYIPGTFFFKMVTLGGNAVITSEECLHPWLNELVKDKMGHWLFEHRNLCEIDNKLKEYDKQLWQTHHMFLPDMDIMPVSEIVPVHWYEQKDIMKLYEDNPFHNALCSKYIPERPDTLAVAAYDGDKMIGMAGCSADTPDLWQIGIDVNDAYRGKGIGTYLVKILKNEVLRRGKIPFYGTSLSNLHSWNIARNSGFYPAWVEVETIE